jgi:Mg-chelatase subunit ChlD
MSLRFEHPLLLLVAVPLALVAVAIHARLATPVSAHRRLWAALHWGALALLVLALAQPQLRTASRPETVLVIDRSASIDAGMRASEDAWVRAIRHARCPQPCRVVQFAAAAQPLPATAAALAANLPSGAAAAGTDIAAGVRTALGLLPHGGRVIVLSDGWAAAGAEPSARAELPAAVAAQARAAGVEIDYSRLSDPTLRYAAVTEIHAPAEVHTGDPVPVQITIRSSVTGPVTLYIERDGVQVGAQTVDVRAGENPLLLSYSAPTPGWHSFQARVVLFSNDMPENDMLGTTVDVVGAPRVLAVSQGGGGALASLLHRLGFAVTSAQPAALPSSAGALASEEDAVVLDDVAASALRSPQASALSSAVRQGGLGLVVLGGPRSFSLGRYANTALDRLLPVTSLAPGNLQRRNVAIELVLDHSGSMIDLAGGVPKIDMVHVAGAEVARFIAAHRDDLGVVDFDVVPHILVPMQQLGSTAVERHVIAEVDGLQANGGTNIYLGLKAGAAQVRRSTAPEKHIILMTDGISEPENYAPLLSSLEADHIQVATIALGSDADKSLLYDIAKATGGNYYNTNDARDLPRIFAKETRFDVKPVKLAGRVKVTPGSDSPVVRSLAGRRLPTLGGNVITTLKAGAQADLLAAGSSSAPDPALAQWQYGVGRVVAFTPGLGAPWASAWSGETALWNDIVRWVERGVSTTPLTPTVIDGAPPSLEIDLAPIGTAAFGVSSIAGVLSSAAGASYPVSFTRVGASLYHAALPALPEGIYRFRLDARGARGLTASGLVAIPYSREYMPRLVADSPLGPLAALTGGRALAAGDPGVAAAGAWDALWWALALAALVLFLSGALGRLVERPPRAGEDYSRTSPATRADSDRRSSTDTSVGART